MTSYAWLVLSHIAGDSPETFADLYDALHTDVSLYDLTAAITELTESGLIEQRYCATDAGRKEADA